MGYESSNFISHALRGDDGDFSSDSLVGMEVQSQLRVVFLDDDTSRFLDGLSTYTLKVQEMSLMNVVWIITYHFRLLLNLLKFCGRLLLWPSWKGSWAKGRKGTSQSWN